MTMATKIKKSIEKDVATLGVLGLLVWWSAIKVRITPAELEKLCEKHGLDKRFLPKPLTPQRAFQRAAEATASRTSGVEIRKVYEDEEEIVYGIMQVSVDEEQRELDGVQVAKVTWNHKTGVATTDPATYAAGNDMVAKLAEFSTYYKTSDVRNMVARVIESAGAISMSAGGQFGTSGRFVPADGQPLMDTLFNVVMAIPGACLDMITVPDDDTSRSTIRRAAKAQFDSDVEQATKELVRLQSDVEQARATNSKGGPKPETIRARLNEFKLIKDRVDLFSDTLRFKADDLNKRLDEVSRGLEALLGV